MQDPTWHAEVEFLVNIEQKDLLGDGRFADGAQNAYYNSAEHILRLSSWVDGEIYAEALAAATAWAEGLAANQLVADAGGVGPVRFTVEALAVRSASWAIGAKEAAELLGFSPARLRQERQVKADFPKPVAEPAGCALYRRDEVEGYAAKRTPSKGGRPRKES